MKKEKKNESPQINTLFSYLSPIKKQNDDEENKENIKNFVFVPLNDEDSSEVIQRKKPKKEENFDEFKLSEDFVSFSSEENEDETVITQRTPISNKQEAKRFSFLADVKDAKGIRRGEEGYDPTTLYISEKEMNALTEFERQFWCIKKDYFDTVVFFKKGKFFELYEDDAEIGSRLFDLKLTERVNMKMAGFPEKSYEYWAGKFLENGYKIAKVDQNENMIAKGLREKDSSKKDKIIKRELKEIVTTGTIYNPEHFKSFNANYLAVIYFSKDISFILYEASFNKIYFSTIKEEKYSNLRNILYAHEIKEIVYEAEEDASEFFDKIKENISVQEGNKYKNFESLEYNIVKKLSNKFNTNEEYKCFMNLINYMAYLKRHSFLETVEVYDLKERESTHIVLDNFTIQNLELFKNNYDGSLKNTLFGSINFCVTGNGQRLLKYFLTYPSKDLKEIERRQNFTKNLENFNIFPSREILKQVGDIERIYGRIFSCNPRAKDVVEYIKALKTICILRNKLNEINLDIPECDSILHEFLNKYLIEGEEIFPEKNSDDELNNLKAKEVEIYDKLMQYLQLKKKELKCDIKFKNIGKEIFQMEISTDVKVPDNFFLVSTTKTTKRFYTLELKELIKEYLENDELIFQSKGSLLKRVIIFLKAYAGKMEDICMRLSELDVFFSYCIFSQRYNTVYPKFTDKLKIFGLRNPIYQNFVETDVLLNESDILILTGPNMGVKSTLMRSICYNIILAQMGMKVFAESFELKVFDNIFTRIGASDNLEKGESTFYVELNETSKILHKSTNNTFIILDELGRGTSVKDGQAIATAVLNYLKDKGCTLIFSTHYFKIVDRITDVNKGFMDVELMNDEVIFKYKLVNGVSNDSMGISVANLANIPNEVIKNALSYKNKLLNK